MLSVWSERVDVYLGQGLVLAKGRHFPLWAFEPPSTMPLADVLERLNHELDRKKGRPWRLHLKLSAKICTPVGFSVPDGVWRYREIIAIAKDSAIRACGQSVGSNFDVVCSLDSRRLGLAAYIQEGVHQELMRWGQEHNGHVASVQPLWAAATGARLCRRKKVSGLALLEPDSLTILDSKSADGVSVNCLPRRFSESEAIAHLREIGFYQSESGQEGAVIWAFRREPAGAASGAGSGIWSRHWSVML